MVRVPFLFLRLLRFLLLGTLVNQFDEGHICRVAPTGPQLQNPSVPTGPLGKPGTKVVKELFAGGEFVMAVLEDMFDFELLGAYLGGLGRPSADDGGF